MLKKIILLFIITFTITTLIFGIGAYLLQHNQATAELNDSLKKTVIYFNCWRYALFLVIILFWPMIINRLNNHLQSKLNEGNEIPSTVLSNQLFCHLNRLHITAFILLFELMFSCNIFSKFITILMNFFKN